LPKEIKTKTRKVEGKRKGEGEKGAKILSFPLSKSRKKNSPSQTKPNQHKPKFHFLSENLNLHHKQQ
jgi:hypothetical protein